MPGNPQSHTSSAAPSRMNFEVDAVTPATEIIWSEPLARRLSSRLNRNVPLLPQGDRLVFDSARNPKSVGIKGHPLIEAVNLAFSFHYPLTLSPDAIWLVIAQGFSHHLAENSEALRGRLVRHQGRQKLEERVERLGLADFERAIAGFSNQIREASDPVLHETLICDFSTTAAAIRTASEVVLMDSYRAYFDYHMMCVCGIPWIAVTGTIEDWQRIRARVEVLETYDLGWWVPRLRPILDEFIQTAQGRPNPVFWKAIFKPKQAYGASRVTGWLADLFPYLDDAPNRRRSHIFNFPREEWAIPVDKGVVTKRLPWRRKTTPAEPTLWDPEADKGVATSSFPAGLSSVPIQLSFPDGSSRELDLVAGYLAVEQDPIDLSLSPVISWAVAEREPATPDRLRF